MPDESVWLEQVDVALIEYLQNVIKLRNEDGLSYSVPVKIRKADEDFKIEEYPSMTIYSLYIGRDDFRYNPSPVVISRDELTNTMVVENCAIPYTLHYQIDFWSKYQTEMNEMTRKWLAYHPEKAFNLPVKDMAGNERSCFVLIYDTLRRIDQVSGYERIYHSVITVKVSVEIDERVSTTIDMITSTQTDVHLLGGSND